MRCSFPRLAASSCISRSQNFPFLPGHKLAPVRRHPVLLPVLLVRYAPVLMFSRPLTYSQRLLRPIIMASPSSGSARMKASSAATCRSATNAIAADTNSTSESRRAHLGAPVLQPVRPGDVPSGAHVLRLWRPAPRGLPHQHTILVRQSSSSSIYDSLLTRLTGRLIRTRRPLTTCRFWAPLSPSACQSWRHRLAPPSSRHSLPSAPH